MDTFLELAKVFGLPGAILVVVIWAFYSGRVVTRAAYEAMLQEKDRQILQEKAERAELWSILRPMIGVANSALEKLEQGTGRKAGQS